MKEYKEEILTGTLCKNCKFRIAEDQITNRKDTWYNHFCAVAPRIVEKDFVTGKVKTRFPYCRDINTDGSCQYYIEDVNHEQVNYPEKLGFDY